MRALVVLSAIVYAVAEPQLLLRQDIPHLHDYRLGLHSHAVPLVRHVVPEVPAYVPTVNYLGLKSQYDERDLIGQARYGHTEPGQNHYAVQDAFGNKIGGFSYFNNDGKLVRTSYIADASGYRVASNDLPTDTPEVLLAKQAHLTELEKAKTRSRRDVFLTPGGTTPLVATVPRVDYHRIVAPIPHVLPTTDGVPIVKPDGFLADTPEVAAAKSVHLSQHATISARTILPITPIVSHYSHTPHLDVAPLSYTPLNVPYVRNDRIFLTHRK